MTPLSTSIELARIRQQEQLQGAARHRRAHRRHRGERRSLPPQ